MRAVTLWNPPPADASCDLLSVLKYWRRSGLGGHKIHSFAAIDLENQTEAQVAVYESDTSRPGHHNVAPAGLALTPIRATGR